MARPRDGRKQTPASTAVGANTGRDESQPIAWQGGKKRRRTLWAVAGIVALGLIAFANSFEGKFVLDDIHEIELNPEMSYLLPPWRSMLAGRMVPARPIPYYTFAIDTALWHRRPAGYHLFNVAIHLGSALMLFSIVRRTLNAPKLVERFGRYSTVAAFCIAALWVVHPLQTQAVTYVYQRIESLMSFFFLAAFSCFLRSQDSAQPKRWLGASFAFTLAAVLCKESGIAIPPILFLYDVVFWTDSWRETVRLRAQFYIALLLTYVPLAVLVLSLGEAYEEFRAPRSALGYALSQPMVMLRYLQLCFYPTEQCLDYLWPIETKPARIVGPLLLISGVFVAGVVGIVRRRPWGWLIAAFFLPLLPTSSVIPVNDLANEHRMYLALAAVATAVVLASLTCYRRLSERVERPKLVAVTFGIVAVVAVFSLAYATHLRNQVYHDRLVMWEDVTAKAPHNTRAFNMLATALLLEGRFKQAAGAARRIIEDPKHSHRGYMLLGTALLEDGDPSGAADALSKALASPKLSKEDRAAASVNLASVVESTDPRRAAELNAQALEADPTNIAALVNAANARARIGDFDGAENILRYSLTIAPDDPRIVERLKKVLADKLRTSRAERP